MITLLIIIFIICMVVMKMKDSPEQEREHQARYLGEDFADKEYYRKEAKRQIKEEDKQEAAERPFNMFIPMRQGYTLPDRVKERQYKLAKLDELNKENNK
ncbi:MAG: hypothetical protein ACTHW2_12135 [Tissierella sp.]|uniref:hypothetical protein n=1 Tax=Tissierella sp. TaxID=41274 RepID=UPI003F9E52CF